MVEVDTLIPIISQETDMSSVIKNSKLKFTKWNTIEAVLETLYTSMEGVFAGEDVVNGPDTVTKAISDVEIAASMIDKYVNGQALIRRYKVTRPAIEVEAVELTKEEMAMIKEPVMPVLSLKERKLNFKKTELSFNKEMAVKEAKRCFRCDLEKPEEGILETGEVKAGGFRKRFAALCNMLLGRHTSAS